MKYFRLFAVFILCFSLSNLCWAQSQPVYWTGSGGAGTRVTVSEPKGTGLSIQEQSLLPLVQSTIIGSLQKYSAMTVFDRQNLENILNEQRLSASGNFSESDYIRIGKLTNARLVVFGSITKISNNYTLELAVTNVETGERKASYMPRQVSLLALENLSAIREASADLLGQLGINLTNTGLQELRTTDDTARIQYENNLARGIAAERQGTVVEALTYYFQAAAFNPSLLEAAHRVSVVSANISSGNLGQSVRSRLQTYDDWRSIITTAQSFYANHLPYELIYNTDISRGRIDFEKRTIDLSQTIFLLPTEAWKTINDLRQGLRNARGNDQWNFSLDQIEPRQITATIQIVNDNNVVLSKESHTFRYLSEKEQANATLNFRNVKADEITDILKVEVVSINGIAAQKAGETGFMQISTSQEYNRRMAPIRAAEQAAKNEQEAAAAKRQQIADEAARKQREADEAEKKKRQRYQHSSLIAPILLEFGYMYQPDYPLGFRTGYFGLYTTWNFKIPNWQGYGHNELTNYGGFIDLHNRTIRSIDGIFGLSINVYDNLLMIPIGIGLRTTNEFGLFKTDYTYMENKSEWYNMNIDAELNFISEIGIAYNPVKYISLIGTLRMVRSHGVTFNAGVCITVPSQLSFNFW